MCTTISERWVFKLYTEEEQEQEQEEEKKWINFLFVYHLKIKRSGIEEEEVEQNRYTSCEQRVLIFKKKESVIYVSS
jgi:hypothetical protein